MSSHGVPNGLDAVIDLRSHGAAGGNERPEVLVCVGHEDAEVAAGVLKLDVAALLKDDGKAGSPGAAAVKADNDLGLAGGVVDRQAVLLEDGNR